MSETTTRTVEIDSHAINFGPQHPAAHERAAADPEMDGEGVGAPIRISACRIAAPRSRSSTRRMAGGAVF
jgi:hypothetical protein